MFPCLLIEKSALSLSSDADKIGDARRRRSPLFYGGMTLKCMNVMRLHYPKVCVSSFFRQTNHFAPLIVGEARNAVVFYAKTIDNQFLSWVVGT